MGDAWWVFSGLGFFMVMTSWIPRDNVRRMQMAVVGIALCLIGVALTYMS